MKLLVVQIVVRQASCNQDVPGVVQGGRHEAKVDNFSKWAEIRTAGAARRIRHERQVGEKQTLVSRPANFVR